MILARCPSPQFARRVHDRIDLAANPLFCRRQGAYDGPKGDFADNRQFDVTLSSLVSPRN